MHAVTNTVDAPCEEFKNDILKVLPRVKSITLYGDGAGDDCRAGKTELNFLVVTDEELNAWDKIQPYILRWRAKKITPLFLTSEYIKRSLDTFPIEFLNMLSQYRVMHGDDVLKDLAFNDPDLRLQCERDLKSHLLHLRQQYLETGGKTRAIRTLVSDSMGSLIAIFRALLHLKGQEQPVRALEVLLQACRTFSLDEGLFSVLLSIKGYAASINSTEIADIMKRYISEVNRLSMIVDKMENQT